MNPADSSRTVSPSACVISPADDVRWFTEHIHAHEAQLKSYLRSSLPSITDVDDVVQESYLRIWRVRAAHPIESTKAFLFTVARRLALNILRKRSNAPFVPLRDLTGLRVSDERPDAAEAACEQEKIDLLADAVMALPGRCREIIILRKLQGLPQKEVARRLGISERTVESQTQIGVKRCLAFLQRHGITNFYGHEN